MNGQQIKIDCWKIDINFHSNNVGFGSLNERPHYGTHKKEDGN